MLKKIAGGIFFVLFVLFAIWFWVRFSNKSEVKEVYIVKPARRNINVSSVWVTGTVEADERKEVFPEICGIVSEILVEEGEVVKEGQELVILNNSEITKQMKEKENNLREAEINLSKSMEEVNLNIQEKEIALIEARNQLQQVMLEAENLESKDYEEIKTALWSLEEGKKNYEKLKKDFTVEKSQKELEIKQLEISKKEAEEELKRREELFEAKIISKKLLEEATNGFEKTKLQYEYSIQSFQHLKEQEIQELDLALLQIEEYEYLLARAKEDGELNKKLNIEKIASAQEKVKNSEQTLSLASGVNQGSVLNPALAEEKLLQSKESLELTREDYLKTIVRSPINGTVTIINEEIDTGKEVKTSDFFLAVADLSNMHIKAQVNQSDISFVQTGQTVIISGGGVERFRSFVGTVSSIAPAGQPGEREDEKKITFEVIIGFEIPEDRTDISLRPGMSMDLEFVTGTSEDTLIVWSKSVVKKGDTSYLFIYNNGRAEKREIEVGLSDMFETEVLSGVSEDELYIMDWEGDLSPGEAVKQKEEQ